MAVSADVPVALTFELKDVSLLRADPGDVIAIKVPHTLSEQDVERLRAMWRSAVAATPLADIPMIILAGGADIAVLRKETAEVGH